MTSRADELEQMKRVDLRIIAAELGFHLNPKRTSRGSACMDHPSGERMLIGLASDGHYVWCAVRGHGSGSVIDLWQQHRGGSLGDVRRALRPFLNGSDFAPSPLHASGVQQSRMLPSLQPIERDTLGVQARYAGFSPLGPHHPYLCEVRGIPSDILAEPFLAERLCIDERGNAIFPHYDDSGLCGWEARNDGFVGFAKGGRKGIFCTVPGEHDQKLVVAESAIDAISYGVIAGHDRARLLSFSGGLNDEQPRLLQQAMSKMPPGSMVIAAVDRDDAGDRYVSVLGDLFRQLGREDLTFRSDQPPMIGCDWNDALRVGSGSPRPLGGGRPEPGG